MDLVRHLGEFFVKDLEREGGRVDGLEREREREEVVDCLSDVVDLFLS